MAHIEIERKFLVADTAFLESEHEAVHIAQGYLSVVPKCTVRVRLRGEKGYITVKGRGLLSRFEWEKEIPAADAEELMKLCSGGIIDKTRHLIPCADGVHTWEVDVFHGENEGLILAEIELGAEDEAFEKPSWLGAEVSGNPRYSNSYLAQNPYCRWS